MQRFWSEKSDFDNFSFNVEFLKQHIITSTYNEKNALICFSHVPKTGGTSLESILFKNFPAADVLHVNAPDLNRQPEVLQLKKYPPKLICGHHPMHGQLYQLLPETPIFHFTQLRHPIDRIISYYNYVLGKTDHPMHTHAKDRSIIEFIQQAPSPELANGQCKRFSGYLHQGHASDEELLSTAKSTLRDGCSLVITTCLYDEGLLLLKNRLNLKDLFYQKRNVSKRFVSRADLSDAQIQNMTANNQADLALYQWAKQRCLQLIDDELSQDQIDQFRSDNLKWSDLVG